MEKPNDVLELIMVQQQALADAYRRGYKAGYERGFREGKLAGLDKAEKICHEVIEQGGS